MGLFSHHEQEIDLDGQMVSVSELVDRYNKLGEQREQASHTIDQLQDQVKSLQGQLVAANSSTADLRRLQQEITSLEDRLQDQLTTNQRLLQEQDRLHQQLNSRPSAAATTLTVDGQTMTANDVQGVIDQWQAASKRVQAANAQLQDLKAKNAELTKEAQAAQSLTIGGKPVTIDEVIDRYNKLLDQLRQAQDQVRQLQDQTSAPATLTVNGEAMTVADVQDLIRQRQAADGRANHAQTQLTQLRAQNTSLSRELAAAKQVTVNGQTMSVTELVQRYYQLLQARQHRPATTTPTAAPTRASQPTTPAASLHSPSSQAALIDRYYRAVQAVLGDYQDQIDQLQAQLTDCLSGNGQTEFLKLAEHSMSPSSYQKMFLERNRDMIRYVENHQRQADLVRPDYQDKNQNDELRGVRYWGNFIYLYRRAVAQLLEQNHNVHRNFRYACHYAKPTALRIGESKPSYLSDQNVMDLRTIHSGIKDEAAWKKDIKKFREQANFTLKGARGERLVRNIVQSYEYNRVLSSLNLPYDYHRGKENSNQIDCIVVNQKGIFILEIKNYTADTIGIDREGFIVTERGGKSYRDSKIVRQGQYHYNAVLKALEADEMVKPYLNYLKHQLHVLYVSTNPHTKIKPLLPGANRNYRFLSLDGLRQYIDSTNGNLRPEVIQAVVEAIDNRQQAEKTYDYFCFPADPAKRAEAAWQQYTIVRQLLDLKLDDLVKRQDPDILHELDVAGLKACDGYVTSKPH